MPLTLCPILGELRDLYDVGALYSLERYWAYKRLLQGGPEVLPLGAFSPMGKRQPEYLDHLLEMDAEGLAAETLREFEGASWLPDTEFRVLLVVVDQPGNGWTQRWITDAAWRFEGEGVPKASQTAEHRWVTVQLWTHTEPTLRYLRSEVAGAVRRAAWQLEHGLPVTFRQMLAQEGAALRAGGGLFGGEELGLDADELEYTRTILKPVLDSEHWPTCFAALYGDEAAREVGYPALGLGALAGFGLALAAEPR
jgi:hypothetical protein